MLGYLDNVVCFFFFLDFWMRLQQAEDKLRFMRWGWIDLLASVPAGGLQAAKLFRAFQVLRVLRAIKSLRLIWRILFRNRAEGIVASAATATMVLVAFGALTMLLVEAPNPQSSINTPEEALWWAFVTVTTVGYGDFYPVTTEGRIVAVLLMVSGVGLLAASRRISVRCSLPTEARKATASNWPIVKPCSGCCCRWSVSPRKCAA